MQRGQIVSKLNLMISCRYTARTFRPPMNLVVVVVVVVAAVVHDLIRQRMLSMFKRSD